MKNTDKNNKSPKTIKHNFHNKRRTFQVNKYKNKKLIRIRKNRILFHKNNNNKYSLKVRTRKKLNVLYIICSNLVGLLLFIISYYFYYLSLEKCFKGDDVCGQNWTWIKSKIEQFIISALIIIFLLVLIIYKIISKLHLFHFFAIFIYFYKYSHSVFFYDHGALNLIGLFIILFLFFLLVILLKILFSIFKIKYKYKIYLILILSLLYNSFIDPTNCDDWSKGLNNTYIKNDRNKYGCQIKFPKKCPYKIMQYSQDLSILTFKSCKNKKKDARETLLKFSKSSYINITTMKFGFPLTNNEEGQKDDSYEKVLLSYASKNLIDMDKTIPQELSYPEYIVDFSKDPLGELRINLRYNKTLSKERKNLEKNTIPNSDNILIIYIDSISRATSIRKLKKTLKFFEQFISYEGKHNKKYPKENFHSFQFFKYHAFEAYTAGNFPKIFYGNKMNAKDYVRIIKYAKQNGYITCYSSDYCNKDNTRIKHNLSKEDMYDHQLLLCDPNRAHVNTITKRCLYGNLNSHHLTDYINQFWRKYHNNRKFGVIISHDAHEGTMELTLNMD